MIKSLLITLPLLLLASCFSPSKYRSYDARLLDGSFGVGIGYQFPVNYDTLVKNDTALGDVTDRFTNIWDDGWQWFEPFMSTALIFRPKAKFQITLGMYNLIGFKYQFLNKSNWFLSSEFYIGGFFLPFSPRGYSLEPNLICTYQFPSLKNELTFALSSGIFYKHFYVHEPNQTLYDYSGYNSLRTHEVAIPFTASMRQKIFALEVGALYTPYRSHWYSAGTYPEPYDGYNADQHFRVGHGNKVTVFASVSFSIFQKSAFESGNLPL